MIVRGLVALPVVIQTYCGGMLPTINLPRLFDKQLDIVESNARFKVILAGRRFGKNILLHDALVRDVLNGKLVGWMSPTYKNLGEDWEKIKELLKPITSEKHEDDHVLTTITGGKLEMWSGVDPEPVRGRRYHMFIFNEAAFIANLGRTWAKIVRMTLADFKGRAIFAGTPNGINDFHTIWSQAADNPEWQRWHYTSYDNPYMDPAEIDASRATMTEDEFRQEVLAEFIEGSGQVFRKILEATVARKQAPQEHHHHVLVGGIDWGKDNDFTVLSVGCATCRREVDLDRFNTIDWYFQSGRVAAMHNKWHVWKWLVEQNSIGGPMLEKLSRMKLPVIGWTATNASKQSMIQGLSLGLESGDIVLLDDEVGKTELQAYAAKKTATGLTTYSAPPGHHDDTIIARGLMYQKMLDAAWQVKIAEQEVAYNTTQSIDNLKTVAMLRKIF